MKEHRQKLILLMRTLIAAIDAPDCTDVMDDFPSNFKDEVERMQKVCLAITCLASPIPGFLDSSPADVEWVLKYKGDNSMVTYVRDAFKDSEAWTKLNDELLAKHSSALLVWQKVQDCVLALKKRPVEKEVIMMASENLSSWKKATRVGSLDGLESELQSALHDAGAEMQKSNGEGYTMQFFSVVQKGLQMYSDSKSFQLCSQLTKLQSKVGQDLLLKDLKTLLDKYPLECSPEAGDKDMGENLDELLRLLQQCKTVSGLQGDDKEKFGAAVFWHFRPLIFKLRASCHCLWESGDNDNFSK